VSGEQTAEQAWHDILDVLSLERIIFLYGADGQSDTVVING
jgi:hypothetical protein